MSDENTSSLLDKWIKDDNMIVTSKMLSREIGSRPNIAKKCVNMIRYSAFIDFISHLLAYYNSNEKSVHPVIAISGRTNSASLQTHLTANLDRLEGMYSFRTLLAQLTEYRNKENVYRYILNLFTCYFSLQDNRSDDDCQL